MNLVTRTTRRLLAYFSLLLLTVTITTLDARFTERMLQKEMKHPRDDERANSNISSSDAKLTTVR